MAEDKESSASSKATAAAGAPAAVGEVVRVVRSALSLDSTSDKEDCTTVFIVESPQARVSIFWWGFGAMGYNKPTLSG